MTKLLFSLLIFLFGIQFTADAMDGTRKRGGDDRFDDQMFQGRLFPNLQDNNEAMEIDDDPWSDLVCETGFEQDAQEALDVREGETKKRKQTVLAALKDLMCEARSNPSLLDPFAIENIVYDHFQEIRDEEHALLTETGLEYLLSEPTGPTDPLLNCKMICIIMNESFQKNRLILDFAKRVSAFWDKLPEIDRERRNAVALFFLTDDLELMAIAHKELFSEYFLTNSTIWPCEAALDVLLQKDRQEIARAFIERVMALPQNQGKDFRNTEIIEQAERIDPALSSLLEEFSALGVKDNKAAK